MKKNLFVYVSIAALFGFLFFLFTFIVKSHRLDSLDFNTTVRLQDHTPLRIDPFFHFLSVLASFTPMVILLSLLMLVRRKLDGVIVVFMFAAAHIVEVFGKVYLHHSGPPFMFFRKSAGYAFEKNYVQPGSSYPSGHSFRVIFVTIVVWYLLYYSRKLPIIIRLGLAAAMLGFTMLVLYSRVSLGEHWTTDVIGGTLFGVGTGALSLAVMTVGDKLKLLKNKQD